MRSDYCKASVIWKAKTLTGDGVSYGSAVTVDNVYIEPHIKLTRGQDDTTTTESSIVLFENVAFMLGDIVEYSGRTYTVTAVSEFYQPRSVIFDHLEVDLREIHV